MIKLEAICSILSFFIPQIKIAGLLERVLKLSAIAQQMIQVDDDLT